MFTTSLQYKRCVLLPILAYFFDDCNKKAVRGFSSMTSPLTRYETPFPIHAREQIKERYGVEFTGQQWFAFGQALRNPNLTIRLSAARQGGYFCACYFMKHWYLLICAGDGTVRTAYPRLAISDEDKLILMRDERYQRINNDEFRVWRGPAPALPPNGKTVELPAHVELPTDISQSAEKFLDRFCDYTEPRQ